MTMDLRGMSDMFIWMVGMTFICVLLLREGVKALKSGVIWIMKSRIEFNQVEEDVRTCLAFTAERNTKEREFASN